MQFQFEPAGRERASYPRGLFNVAEVFLNENLGGKYYGPGMRHVVFSVRESLPRGRSLKIAWRYQGSFAEHLLVEMRGQDVPQSQLSRDLFYELMNGFQERLSETRQWWQGEFRLADFSRDLADCLSSAPQTTADLQRYSTQLDQIRPQAMLGILRAREEHRFRVQRPRDQAFVGLRIYVHGALENKLEPHLSISAQLLEGLLRNYGWLCPVYREIYINVAQSLEEARLNRAAIEDWHENAYAVIDLIAFENSNADVREQLVLQALAQSLRDLAGIDHLDLEPLERAVARIQATGRQTDLIYLWAENDHYSAKVLYRVMEDGAEPSFRLEVFDKSRGNTGTVELGRHDLWWLPYRFGKLVLKSKEAVIEARKSLRAQVALQSEQAPQKLRFTYADIFKNSDLVL